VSIIQFLIMAAVAVLVAAPIVWLIPRARQSPTFDRVLWAATGTLAFLGAWAAPSYIAADSALNNLVVADVAVLPTLMGAAAGALSVNLVLWLIDRLSQPPTEEISTLETASLDEEENVKSGATDPDE